MRVSDLSPASVDALLQGRLGRPYTFVEECPSTQRLVDAERDRRDDGRHRSPDPRTRQARPDVGGAERGRLALLRAPTPAAADGDLARALARRRRSSRRGAARADRYRSRAGPSERRPRPGRGRLRESCRRRRSAGSCSESASTSTRRPTTCPRTRRSRRRRFASRRAGSGRERRYWPRSCSSSRTATTTGSGFTRTVSVRGLAARGSSARLRSPRRGSGPCPSPA